MRSKGRWLGVLVAAIGLAGARDVRGQATHVTVVKSLLVILDKVADGLGQVKDQATAEKVTAVLAEGAKQLKQLNRILEPLGKPSPEQNEKVKQLEKNVNETLTRFVKESTGLAKKLRAAKVPAQTQKDLRKALQDFCGSLKAFGDTVRSLDKKED